ncbi:MAG: deoxyribodipyrimidine photo-lyase, partial [Deltaproteobacteria bacterium]|nr:deoxyribodipyrimidine photo-lyase [Deltaproteobacteria bacterium]
GADTLYYSRRYEPAIIKRDKQLKASLKTQGIQVKSFNANLLVEPWELETQTGNPYQVFTPFWKKLLASPKPRAPFPKPKSIKAYDKKLKSLKLEDLKLLPKIHWDQGFYKKWQIGESSAQKKLKEFLKNTVLNYQEARDFPAKAATSELSPHLHFGEISPHQIWEATNKAIQGRTKAEEKKALEFLREVAWREFAYHLLYYFPHTTKDPLKEKFKAFPWKQNKTDLKKWQEGQTGYPIVDAGMRELWATGIMHNRVRMIVASFLVKDLMIPWQEGAKWFWETLVDADLANNTLGWQWTAGCGADASPYFRIFNPITQASKFDPEARYIKTWIPELKEIPPPHIFKPWEAPQEVLEKAKIKLGQNYPKPMVDHALAREEALEAYGRIKSK